MLVSLKAEYDVRGFAVEASVNGSERRGGGSAHAASHGVRRVVLHASSAPCADLASLRADPSAWRRVAALELGAGRVRAALSLALPVVAAVLLVAAEGLARRMKQW